MHVLTTLALLLLPLTHALPATTPDPYPAVVPFTSCPAVNAVYCNPDSTPYICLAGTSTTTLTWFRFSNGVCQTPASPGHDATRVGPIQEGDTCLKDADISCRPNLICRPSKDGLSLVWWAYNGGICGN